MKRKKRKVSVGVLKPYLKTLMILLILSILSTTIVNAYSQKFQFTDKDNYFIPKDILTNDLKTYKVMKSEPIYRVETMKKELSISFDVNWAEEEQLYKILDVLDKYNVKATFFIMGKWVVYPDEGNLDKLKEIEKRGHEIGNHSYAHADFQKISNEKMIKEIKDTEETILKEIGVKTKLFRFPSGSYNENGVKIVESLGYKAIQWDVDSVDWKALGLDREYNRVIKNVKPGSIVLFHNDGKYTQQNLDRLIPELKAQGYNFVPIGQLLYKDNYYIDNEGVQRLKEK